MCSAMTRLTDSGILSGEEYGVGDIVELVLDTLWEVTSRSAYFRSGRDTEIGSIDRTTPPPAQPARERLHFSAGGVIIVLTMIITTKAE